jgi:hypothetical protein
MGAGENDGRPRLDNVSARKGGDDNIPGGQRCADSCSSKLRKEAALASSRSCPVHASDHSTGLPLARSLSWLAHVITFSAVSGGSARRVRTRSSSFSLRVVTTSIMRYSEPGG